MKILKAFRNIVFLNLFLITGTIAAYACNDDFKTFMDNIVGAESDNKSPPIEIAEISVEAQDSSEELVVAYDSELQSEHTGYVEIQEAAYIPSEQYEVQQQEIQSYEIQQQEEQEDISLSEETIDIDTANEISKEEIYELEVTEETFETEVFETQEEEVYIPEEETQQETVMYVIDHNDTGGDYFEEPIYDKERGRILLNSVIVIPGNFNGWTLDEVLRWKKDATYDEQQAMYDQSYPWYPVDADIWEPEQLKLWAIIEPITIRNRFDRVVLWGTGYDVNN